MPRENLYLYGWILIYSGAIPDKFSTGTLSSGICSIVTKQSFHLPVVIRGIIAIKYVHML